MLTYVETFAWRGIIDQVESFKYARQARHIILEYKDLKATQIFARIVDEKKREAADKIKLDL